MTTIPYWLRPYYALRHPPEDALAYQIAYAILAVGAAMSAGVHDAEHIDASLAILAAVFSTIGGVIGWLSQYRGLWFLERGAIWFIWGGLTVRSVVVAMIADASPFEIAARVSALLTVCVLLVPRYRGIAGADQDPRK